MVKNNLYTVISGGTCGSQMTAHTKYTEYSSHDFHESIILTRMPLHQNCTVCITHRLQKVFKIAGNIHSTITFGTQK